MKVIQNVTIRYTDYDLLLMLCNNCGSISWHFWDIIFNVEKYRNPVIQVKSQSGSLKVVPFDRLDMVSYPCSIVTLSLRCTISEVFDFKMPWPWKPMLRVGERENCWVQSTWKAGNRSDSGAYPGRGRRQPRVTGVLPTTSADLSRGALPLKIIDCIT